MTNLSWKNNITVVIIYSTGIKVKPIKTLFEKVTYIFLKIAYMTYKNLYSDFAWKNSMLNYILLVGMCLCQITFYFSEITALNII